MVQDDPNIAKRKQGRQVKKAAEDAAGLTIAERLTRRAKAKVVSIQLLADEDGDLTIDMHLPSWGYTCELAQMETLMTTKKGHNRIAEIMDDLCQTQGIDIAFWKSGMIGISDMRALLEGLTSESIKATQRVKEAQTFRED